MNSELITALRNGGADLVGIGDLTGLPAETRENLPIGISVAVKYPPEVIRGIAHLPSREYSDWKKKINEKLDDVVILGEKFLRERGYNAIARTREVVNKARNENNTTALPHKTVATRAGLGWIGKCALLVTKELGSRIRISSILTDAPLAAAEPINESRCGNCIACVNACPGGAVVGNNWRAGMEREELLNHLKCEETAKERSLAGFGKADTVCGKCIEVCPYTRKSDV